MSIRLAVAETVHQVCGRIGKLLCKVGRHKPSGTALLADLDTYWMQGGERCSRCGLVQISFGEARQRALFAYERGKQRTETQFIARGDGINRLVAMYGKDAMHRLIDET